MEGTGSGSCPLGIFDISNFEALGFITVGLVNQCVFAIGVQKLTIITTGPDSELSMRVEKKGLAVCSA
jgi:hypothetical protein